MEQGYVETHRYFFKFGIFLYFVFALLFVVFQILISFVCFQLRFFFSCLFVLILIENYRKIQKQRDVILPSIRKNVYWTNKSNNFKVLVCQSESHLSLVPMNALTKGSKTLDLSKFCWLRIKKNQFQLKFQSRTQVNIFFLYNSTISFTLEIEVKYIINIATIAKITNFKISGHLFFISTQI